MIRSVDINDRVESIDIQCGDSFQPSTTSCSIVRATVAQTGIEKSVASFEIPTTATRTNTLEFATFLARTLHPRYLQLATCAHSDTNWQRCTICAMVRSFSVTRKVSKAAPKLRNTSSHKCGSFE